MLGIAGILLLGIGAQWLAWRLRMPSILLLLLVGFVVGPLTGHRFLDPDALLGDSLLPFVSLAVAVILLEGGTSLRFRELQGAGPAVRNLVIVGTPVTFVLAALAARWTLGADWGLSLLLGAILVVTGPTVIIPLLRHVRPTGVIARVVRWEGIVTDPLGAILGVLVFQAMLVVGSDDAFSAVATGLVRALCIGLVLGLLGAATLVFALWRNHVPDFLHSSAALAIAVGTFVLSNTFQHESGLLAVTVMGVALANQHYVVVEHIVEFKENLRVLLISSLFILLAARLPMEEIQRIDWRAGAFVALLILVVRPIAAVLSTVGSGLSWQERTFVAWMAPRGIVAAAVASVFSLGLVEADYPQAERLTPVVFLVIVATVAVYGLTSAPLARWLGLSKGVPQGVVFLGAHEWAREIAQALKEAEVDVLLVDTNHKEVQAARMAGLEGYHGNVFANDFELCAPLDDMGYLLALTYNDEVNALACLHFAPIFERSRTFQVAPGASSSVDGELPKHLRGNVPFSNDVSFWHFQSRFGAGAEVKRTKLTEEFDYDDFKTMYAEEGAPVVPLFTLDAEGRLSVVDARAESSPTAGKTLIALVGGVMEPEFPDLTPVTSSAGGTR